jgi:hypothetical protein
MARRRKDREPTPPADLIAPPAEPSPEPDGPPPTPTPEEVKALIDKQDWVWQERLWQLLLTDPNSHMGRNVLSLLASQQVRIDLLEALNGIGLGDIDPEELLSRKESLKQAAKRLGKDRNAVKQARHRARQRLAKLKSTMPVVTTDGGRVVQVTPQP